LSSTNIKKEDQREMPNSKTAAFLEGVAELCKKHDIVVNNIDITVKHVIKASVEEIEFELKVEVEDEKI
jgi:hypothetical protein